MPSDAVPEVAPVWLPVPAASARPSMNSASAPGSKKAPGAARRYDDGPAGCIAFTTSSVDRSACARNRKLISAAVYP